MVRKRGVANLKDGARKVQSVVVACAVCDQRKHRQNVQFKPTCLQVQLPSLHTYCMQIS